MERPGRLSGKIAIVTGAGARGDGIGNGRAVAILFAREGAQVLLVGRREEPLERTRAMIEEDQEATGHDGGAAVCVADVTVAANCERMVADAVERWGRLDILHNNVGLSGPGSILATDEVEWERVLRSNVISMMLACQHAIPVMTESGGGSIINISSISAIRPRGLTPYSTSKGAVLALSRALAIDHGRDGIRSNCIIVGPVFTPMVDTRTMTAERREQRRLASPLGIEGSAWDVAHAAVYLASDEARYVTGVDLPVDGGVSVASARR